MQRGMAVLLRHQGHGPDHWDLIWARGQHCPTLRIAAARIPGKLICSWSFPHRRFYLDYRGPVSANRGDVSHVLQGPASMRVMGNMSLVLCRN